MSIETLKGMMPEYAKDNKLNLSTLANDETLSKPQLWGTFLATAIASRNANVLREIASEAAEHLSEAEMNGAKAAASIMSMNNVYYKFTEVLEDYRTMPAKLRMNILANPGVDTVDFEIWALAVSAINGCKACVLAHEKTLRDHDISKEQVQTAVRIASTIHAVAVTLEAEVSFKADMAEAA